jgi:hypothetical protein
MPDFDAHLLQEIQPSAVNKPAPGKGAPSNIQLNPTDGLN